MYSPKEIAQNYVATGTAKSKLPISKMLLLGILAGMFIALAAVGSIIGPATVPTASLGKLIGACVFPTGLAMVLIGGSELFTGNCMIVISVLEREAKLMNMLKNWLFVYLGNFIGALLVALITVYGGTFSLFGNTAAASLIHTAVVKVSLPFHEALLRGILCNVLVCIAVWMAYAAKDIGGKVLAMFLPVMLFVLCGFEHSVANMFYIPGGILASQNTVYAAAASAAGDSFLNLRWGSMIVNNLIPVTIGNIIGGSGLIGCMYWLIYLRDPSKKTQKKK